MIDYVKVKEAIDSESANSSRSDADIADWLNSEGDFAAGESSDSTATVVQETMANSRQLLANLDPAVAAAILDALETASAVDSAVKWAMYSIKSEEGIDLGHSNTRTQIDQLVTASVLTSAQGVSLKGLAEFTKRKREEFDIFDNISAQMVNIAKTEY